MANFSSLFQSNVPDLSAVSAMPGLDLGQQMGAAGPMTNMSANFAMPPQPDFMGMLSAFGGMGGGQPQAPMMPAAPAPHLQAGGDQFAAPYHYQPFQLQPTAQRLGGLLSGAGYGTV